MMDDAFAGHRHNAFGVVALATKAIVQRQIVIG